MPKSWGKTDSMIQCLIYERVFQCKKVPRQKETQAGLKPQSQQTHKLPLLIESAGSSRGNGYNNLRHRNNEAQYTGNTDTGILQKQKQNEGLLPFLRALFQRLIFERNCDIQVKHIPDTGYIHYTAITLRNVLHTDHPKAVLIGI